MRLIDADALKKEVDNFQNCYNGWSDTYDKAYVIEAIEEAPTIEPKRGEWIYGEHDVAMCDGYRCDKCGFFVPWDYKHKFIDFINDYHFCPHCGADMRKESE